MILRRRLAASTACVVLVLSLAACGSDPAEPQVAAPVATGVPSAPGQQQPAAPTAAPNTQPDTVVPPADPAAPTTPVLTGRSGVASPPFARPGEVVLVTGTNWPSQAAVTASVCGNNFLQGSVDCASGGAGQAVSRVDGTVSIEVEITNPPKPCPCVIRMATQADTTGVSVPFEIIGAPTAPPQINLTSRQLDVEPRVTGTGPIAAFFGGAAERQLVLKITNIGSAPLAGLPLVLTIGKGQDPTDPILTAEGLAPTLPDLAVGEVVEIELPVTIEAPALGRYTIKGQFSGLEVLSVNGVKNNVGDLSFTTTASSYPWGLILVGWLLLQIPLLGLYKRRPVVIESGQDAVAPVDEVLAAPYEPAVVDGFAQGVFDAPLGVPPATAFPPPPPAAALPPAPPGFRIVSAAPGPPLPAADAGAVIQSGRPGVGELRSLLGD